MLAGNAEGREVGLVSIIDQIRDLCSKSKGMHYIMKMDWMSGLSVYCLPSFLTLQMLTPFSYSPLLKSEVMLEHY